MKLVEAAFAFAFRKHDGQLRKYTAEPYIVHPIAVADLVRTINARDEMVAAALLHDVLEDTDATPDELKALFGDEVTNLVIDLTDVYVDTELHGNRAIRKAKEAERLAGVGADAQTIKVVDMIDNTKTIVALDPDFAVLYMKEKAALFNVLTKAHPALRAMM